MITFKNITMKNFLSTGNVPQSIIFNDGELTLVLGNNLDLGGNGSKNGVGKAQPLYSKIKTPDGWTTFNNIKVGDKVSTPDGKTGIVDGVFPQGYKQIYKITFADGRSTNACEDHLWKIYSNYFKKDENKTKVISTNEIISIINENSNKKNKSGYYMYVPLITDLSEDINLPLNPYLLGVLLGDGSFRSGSISLTSNDIQIIDNIIPLLPENTSIKPVNGRKYSYRFKSSKRTKLSNLRKIISNLGLYNKFSYEKHIPEIYKNSGINQKIDLIAGLIDTDGYITKTGSISISTSSEKMAYDVQEIIWSMGGICKISTKQPYYSYKNIKQEGKINYNLSIRLNNPKRLSKISRKYSRIPSDYQYNNLKLKIDKIEKVGLEECKCISVNHPDHLYITDNFIVTHNTSFLQAISFALYGVPLTNIKKDNLINITNQKDMLVVFEFEKNNIKYKIERGRKPAVFRFYVDNKEIGKKDKSETNDALGENADSQKEIDKIIGMDATMFRHLVALNTFTNPFLSMPAKDQRDIIEKLLGITMLSEKADLLRKQISLTDDKIKEEEYKIKAIDEANQQIEKSIKDLERRQKIWENNKSKAIESLSEELEELSHLDIEIEIQNHNLLQEYITLSNKKSELDKKIKDALKNLKSYYDLQSRYQTELSSLSDNKCYACNQEIHNNSHEEMLEEKQKSFDDIKLKISDLENSVDTLQAEFELIILPEKPTTYYKNISEAYEHKSSIQQLEKQIELKIDETDQYQEQITNLKKSGIKLISWDKLNDLSNIREHQKFLLKLLTNKDSFIRKKIIEQNLVYLNTRLDHYLDKLGLPHSVVFQSDLSVNISNLGRDLDFDNLSRGERNRLILGLSWSFRDVFESMNDNINFLAIDELVDSGLDTVGVESALELLKQMSRERNKSIMLISHREELIGRVNKILMVTKESGFTSYSYED